MSDSQLIGRGWSFPPDFFNPMQGPEMVTDEDEIRQALRVIIDTHFGERAMRPDFGSPVADFMFGSLDAGAIAILAEKLSDVLLRFEPRIELESVEVDDSKGMDGLLTIQVDYRVRQTNVRDNLVYPFYLQEASSS